MTCSVWVDLFRICAGPVKLLDFEPVKVLVQRRTFLLLLLANWAPLVVGDLDALGMCWEVV